MGVAPLLDNYVDIWILVRQLTMSHCMEKTVFSLNMSKKLVRYRGEDMLKRLCVWVWIIKKKKSKGRFHFVISSSTMGQ